MHCPRFKPKETLVWKDVLRYKIIHVSLPNSLSFWKRWFITILGLNYRIRTTKINTWKENEYNTFDKHKNMTCKEPKFKKKFKKKAKKCFTSDWSKLPHCCVPFRPDGSSITERCRIFNYFSCKKEVLNPSEYIGSWL